MGKLSDRISTAGKKATGGVKNVVSKATDDAHRETEGDAQPLKGTGQGRDEQRQWRPWR